jgi:brefeldin A-resistance guanine nucleotide exchange factor 1
MYIKAKFRGKHSEELQELIPELLRNILQVVESLPIFSQCFPCPLLTSGLLLFLF